MLYPSLSGQLCIGGVYVRLLLEGGDASECGREGSGRVGVLTSSIESDKMTEECVFDK